MISYKKNGKIRTLLEDLRIFNERIPKSLIFESNFLDIKNQVMTIKKPFSWNGCDFARDWKETDRGSCGHDVLLLYKIDGIDRKTKDLIFLDILKEDKFKFAEIYYKGVRFWAVVRGKK